MAIAAAVDSNPPAGYCQPEASDWPTAPAAPGSEGFAVGSFMTTVGEKLLVNLPFITDAIARFMTEAAEVKAKFAVVDAERTRVQEAWAELDRRREAIAETLGGLASLAREMGMSKDDLAALTTPDLADSVFRTDPDF